MRGGIFILSGAGLSAESGLRTFRAADGLWEDHRVEDVATPEAFVRDPAQVQRFYNMRRAQAALAEPNAAHRALARLQAEHDRPVHLVTQNVDDLLERAGAREVIHMHGALAGALCAACGSRWPAPAAMAVGDPCPSCGAARTRPDIVWFGEIPYHMDRIEEALEESDLFVAVGTSGTVYPAAGFGRMARALGIRTLELNLEASGARFDEQREGPASAVVPAWVAEVLGG
ncbi:NAD-dependent deacylase [Celeribacter indicus]|uniref:NAD-dependent protein deacylase n=1 Tax=Celeribacter indicus TaxID=1208324 RepID=A0A0B5DR79_9RHOB|nr:NAD-dependent deacylase [Celeribacter indicus]AJE45584.1 silent information regulator protein Sir2 [Celeribacter indicus]SDW85361.1 NAD-dependent deacetylase [Celeribacter indicus]